MDRSEFLINVETLAKRFKETRPIDNLRALIDKLKEAAAALDLPIPIAIETKTETDEKGDVARYSRFLIVWSNGRTKDDPSPEVHRIVYAGVFDPLTTVNEEFEVEDFYAEETAPLVKVGDGDLSKDDITLNRKAVAERLQQYANYYARHERKGRKIPKGQRPGRTQEYNHKADKRLVTAWKESGLTADEFALKRSTDTAPVTGDDVRAAADRVRKLRK